jgi:putative ABC transport system permease protein
MFFRILKRSFLRRKKRKALAVIVVALGSAVIAALLSVSLVIGDRLQQELRTYGANLEVVPQSDTLPIEINGVDYRTSARGAYLDERELPKLKTIFWRHNIVAFAPYLPALGELQATGQTIPLIGTWFDKPVPVEDEPDFRAGVKYVSPYWQVKGGWASDESSVPEAMVGAQLAETLNLSKDMDFFVKVNGQVQRFRVAGIVRSGGVEDNQVYVPLAVLQRLMNLPFQIKKIQVSALTTPENELAKKDPDTMTPEEYETWYCTPYISAIAYQIEEVITNAKARPILQVAESEGVILSKIKFLLLLIALAAAGASILAVASAMTAIVLERRAEIGLLKAIGASHRQVEALFLSEAGLIGFVGGLIGFGLGLFLAQVIGKSGFGMAVPFNSAVVLVTATLAIGIALLGSLPPVLKVTRLQPVAVLHGQV